MSKSGWRESNILLPPQTGGDFWHGRLVEDSACFVAPQALRGDLRSGLAGGAGAGGAVGRDSEPVAGAADEVWRGKAAFGGRGDYLPTRLAGGIRGHFEDEVIEAAFDGAPVQVYFAVCVALGGFEAFHFGHRADGAGGADDFHTCALCFSSGDDGINRGGGGDEGINC